MNSDLLNQVSGGPELLKWFGYAPRFHDAEVLRLDFDREGATCHLVVHGFEMTKEVDARGFFVCTKHVVTTFLLKELTNMEIDGFSSQNAVLGITIMREPGVEFRIEIEPANGLGGVIGGRSLEITMVPGIPPGSQYARLAV
jgi:hypothetical protein